MFYAGSRYYPWFVYDGWHIDAFAAYQEFNRGGIVSRRTEEADAFGGGLGFGYTLPIHKYINIDFSACGWLGAKKYTVYNCTTCGRIEDKGVKFFAMPTNINISITLMLDTIINDAISKRKNKIE